MFNKKASPNIELESVYTTQDEAEARMVQELLRNNGIGSVIQSEISSTVYPLNTGDLGKKDILVLKLDEERAIDLLNEYYGESDDEAAIEDEEPGEGK